MWAKRRCKDFTLTPTLSLKGEGELKDPDFAQLVAVLGQLYQHAAGCRGVHEADVSTHQAGARHFESFGPTVEFEVPRGGMYLWVKLPEGVDSRALNIPALREGVAFNPGPDWSADPDAAASYIRLCFALPSESEIWEGVEKMADIFRREGALP